MTFTRKQIIAWAREANFEELVVDEVIHLNELKHFAALIEQAVRADENEQCAKVCEEYGVGAFNNDDIICDICADKIRARRNQARAALREQLEGKK